MFYKVQGNDLHYQVIGEGTPILLLHGLTCSSDLMIGCMEPIFERKPGYQRIYVDLPGMGGSSGNLEVASSNAILDILLSFIDAELAGKAFLLVGESYVGYLARGILAEKVSQVLGLMLICPLIKLNPADRILPQKSLVVGDLSIDKEDKVEEFFQIAVKQTAHTYQRFEKEVVAGK